MAQMGSFVPADVAVIPVRDRLLSRIGTGDDMENNVSTFLMEMREVSQVCNNETPLPDHVYPLLTHCFYSAFVMSIMGDYFCLPFSNKNNQDSVRR